MLRVILIKALTVAAFLPTLALADNNLRVNCRPDISNPVPNTCVCDIKAKGSSSSSGYSMFSCEDLACEEFEQTLKPSSCENGMRGVTCWVRNPYYYTTCTLMMPRVPETEKAPDICEFAVNDINTKNNFSSYYKFLNRSCIPAGYYQPPFRGWEFIGSFVEGWD